MEKRDIIMVVLGLAIVLVAAFVVKPMVTGKPLDTSIPTTIPGIATPTPSPVPTVDGSYERYKASQNMGTVTAAPTYTPTATPSWSGQAKGLGFVDPARYNQTPAPTPIPHTGVSSQVNGVESNPLVIYATIQGKDPGSTEPIPMPFPYWELRYTVDPYDTTYTGTASSKEAGVASSVATQVYPSFSISVMDADQPNVTVRTITPPGGLNKELWKKGKEYDPRPWVEKFYEGIENHNYYFVITPHMVHSYRIDVMVPQKYIGKY